MLLITDFHAYGSLFEYLQRGETLSVSEALHLAYRYDAFSTKGENRKRGVEYKIDKLWKWKSQNFGCMKLVYDKLRSDVKNILSLVL